jgi:hypothetical protein
MGVAGVYKRCSFHVKRDPESFNKSVGDNGQELSLHIGTVGTVCITFCVFGYTTYSVRPRYDTDLSYPALGDAGGRCYLWYSYYQTDRDPTDYLGLRLPWLRGRS